MQSRITVQSSNKRGKKSLIRRFILVIVSLIVLLSGGIPSALAVTVPMDFPRLAQVGPIHEDNGFPVWYEDSQGTQLQLCIDQNDPLCAMILSEIPNPANPISFQDGNFPGEAFYQLAEAEFSLPNGGSALGVFALEAAFANEVPTPGDQIVFGRVRLRITGLQSGSEYTISHPYGTEKIVAAGGEINFTEDIGINTGFQGALTSRIGTFLQWDTGAPAGYLGDPNVAHRIIGGINNGIENQNYFRIEGPGIGTGSCGANCAQTDFFSVMGKIATEVLAAPVVNPVTDQDTIVTGTAEVGTTVEVKSGTTSLGTDIADAGAFSVTIPAQLGGTVLSVRATDTTTGNTSRVVRVTVQDTVAPTAPVADILTDHDIALTGTAEVNSTVIARIAGSEVGRATTGTNGKFSINIPKQPIGNVLAVTAEDQSGNVSPPSQVTVINKLQKLIGDTRYSTAVEISKQGWATSNTVLLSNGAAIVDGLTATPLAAAKNAPLLLTTKDTLPTETLNEIKRLKATEVILIGGTGVTSPQVESFLISQGLTITRIGGADRYETSLLIAKELDKLIDVETIFMANGFGEPDALSIAAQAGKQKQPVILTNSSSVPTATLTWLGQEGLLNAYFIGGEGVISPAVISQIETIAVQNVSNNRISGLDRHETNAKVIQTFYKELDLPTVMVAKSETANLVDALAVGPLAARMGVPVLLVSQSGLQPSQKDVILSKKSKQVHQVGGGINEAVINAVVVSLD